MNFSNSTQSFNSNITLSRNFRNLNFDKSNIALIIVQFKMKTTSMLYFLIKVEFIITFAKILKYKLFFKIAFI